MWNEEKNTYLFGVFTLEVNERRLLRNGQTIHLQPKAFDTLLVLVANKGHLVTKEKLLEAVWSGSFVEENNLTKNIHALRKALENGVDDYIETVPKVGYRFKADASVNDELVIEKVTNSRIYLKETFQEEITGPTTRQKYFRRGVVIAVAAMLVVTGGFALIKVRQRAYAAAMIETSRIQAREAYTRGRALWQTRDAKDLHQATVLLERAVALDPELAIAHSALADAYAFDFAKWKKAEASARESIRLDPMLGEPHAAIGFVRMFWEWKFDEAEAEFKKAIQLSPDYATAHQWYSMNLAIYARKDAALFEIERAMALDPRSPSINADRCQMLYFAHRFEEAIEQCKQALSIDPNFINAHANIYEIYTVMGRNSEAIEEYFAIKRLREGRTSQQEPVNDKELRQAFAVGGIRRFWQALTVQLAQEGQQYFTRARYYARLGDRDKAIASLNQAFENHDLDLVLVAADPLFDDYHIDRNDLTFLGQLLNSANRVRHNSD